MQADSRPSLIVAADGSKRCVGAPGERELALNERLAVNEGADQRSVRVIDLVDANRIVFSSQTGLRPEAAITPDLIVLRDKDKDRPLAFSQNGATKLVDVESESDVVGYGKDALILARGRTIGMLPLPGAA